MQKRFVSIWFRYLLTDWFTLRQPLFKQLPLVLRSVEHGRMVVHAANRIAESSGIRPGVMLADARAITPGLQVLEDRPDLPGKLLRRLAEWCIRFSPIVAVDLPDGLILDATGCSHLWGGEARYLEDIKARLQIRGYNVRIAMADTHAVAWGMARYGKNATVVPSGKSMEYLSDLPPESLRLDPENIERLHKLGLHQVRQFISMPRSALMRRFGAGFLQSLDRAIGLESEPIVPVIPVEPYEERLACLEPIVTATGIEIALEQLLKTLCLRLQKDQKGIRTAVFKCYRTDGKMVQVETATSRPSHSVRHLQKLFELKLGLIEPGWGIELFVLVAPVVEEYLPQQEEMWGKKGEENERLSELVDRLAARISMSNIHRYVPDEHYWPERSYKRALTLNEENTTYWRNDKNRPVQLLATPERIEVTAPIPDYPPMLFRYKGILHKIIRADGPERIEQEWWLQQGQHRDYYYVEDDRGERFWLFRLGHYHESTDQWYLHGFFA